MRRNVTRPKYRTQRRKLRRVSRNPNCTRARNNKPRLYKNRRRIIISR